MANISQSFWSGQHLDADHVEQRFFFYYKKAQWLPIGLSLFIFLFLCFASTLKKAVH